MKVVPKTLSQSAETGSAKQSFIAFQMYDASGVALGAEAKMEVQAFLDKFGVGEERPEAIGTFDFGGFPALLAALQDAHVLEARKSVLPRDQAWEALAEIGGKPVNDDATALSSAPASRTRRTRTPPCGAWRR